MNIRTIKDFDFNGKRVLLRIDINAAIAHGRVLDSPRFIESAKTIKELINKKARIAAIAHQGRKGDRDYLPLEQHARILSKHIGSNIKYVDALFENAAKRAISDLKPAEAILLRNVRDYTQETNLNNPALYKKLCKNLDIYVNDAFSVCHREQGSIVLPPKYLPSCMGLSLEREWNAISNFSFNNKEKNIFMIGGAKIEDYIEIFNVLKNPKNKIIASGILGNLFLVGRNYNLGFENNWLKENQYLKFLPQITEIDSRYKEQIILPIDFAIGDRGRKEVSLHEMPFDKKILDVGKKSITLFKSQLNGANSVFMKGPLGYTEYPEFSKATVEILKAIAILTKNKKIFSLLGGGHLTTTIQKYKIPNTFSYISLSGGALIKAIAGNNLPGIEALKKGKK